MNRKEFQMALEELIIRARPDMDIKDMDYSVRTLEEDMFGKRGRDDDPLKSAEGYAGQLGGKEVD